MKRLLLTLALVSAVFGSVQAVGVATTFPQAENPISEGGRWINGKAVGLDWKDVRTSQGFAYGADASGAPNYNDPTALLTGNWGPDQTAEGKVRTVNQRGGSVYQEVEIRLRSTLSAHWNSGYEINFRCTHDGSQYVEIVRWNGRLGDFAYVNRGSGPGLYDGDTVKATIVGNVITAYINGQEVVRGTDNTFTSGSPGMGFYNNGAPNGNVDFGFVTFTATDGGALPSAPTNLRIVPSL